MGAIQTVRQRSQTSGNLKATPQQTVSNQNGSIVIAPANPSLVYVPVYDPWAVYGAPLAIYPGFYYAPPPGVVFGAGLAIGSGIGIGIGVFAYCGWGWNNWRLGWHSRAVVFNHTTYFTHSRTVTNHGFNRPGGLPVAQLQGVSYGQAARTNRGTTHSFNQARAQRGGRSAGSGREAMRAGRSSGGEQRGGKAPVGARCRSRFDAEIRLAEIASHECLNDAGKDISQCFDRHADEAEFMQNKRSNPNMRSAERAAKLLPILCCALGQAQEHQILPDAPPVATRSLGKKARDHSNSLWGASAR
jgi:hypothetical protein